MRKLRQLSMAVLLAFMVSASAFAGIIGCPPEPAPEPPPESSATAPGIIGTSPSNAESTAPSNSVVDVALNLLQSVLLAF